VLGTRREAWDYGQGDFDRNAHINEYATTS
jgi:hypothetical protein